jgi:putative membrane protein
MSKIVLAGAVVLAMSVTPVFAQTPPEKAHDAAAQKAMGSDQHFVTGVAKNGMAEVELAQLAQQKASSDQVKQFAQRMATDHGKANDELKTLAQNKNITLPTAVDPEAKAMHDKLSKMSGEQFDHAYMQHMVTAHRKSVDAFRMESKSGKDADVKSWAAKTLPTVEEHLKMAQDANKAVGTSGTTEKPKTKGR